MSLLHGMTGYGWQGATCNRSINLNRVALSNFGDHKFCKDGVWELRIDVGAGYRVYYGIGRTDRLAALRWR